MKRHLFSFVVIASQFIAKSSCADLLDEIVAGCEANLNAIQSGHAKYEITTARFAKGQEQPKEVENYDVRFDFPRIRIDSEAGQMRRIFSVDQVISFDAKNLAHLSKLGPTNFSATIRSRDEEQATISAHPRMLGPEKIESIANEIRLLQSNPKWQLDAHNRKDGLIALRCRSKQLYAEVEYLIAPTLGYGVVSVKEWALSASPTKPYFVMSAQFRKIDPGVFVLEQRETVISILSDGKLEPYTSEEVRLKEITLTRDVDASAFTLDGLGLPAGARVMDKVHGRNYLFGLPETPSQ